MKWTHIAVALALAGCAAGSRDPSPATLDWRPSWPGTQMAVLRGNPFGSGEFAFQFRMPAGYWIHPHTHPVDARIRVVSGTFLLGQGTSLDTSAVRVMRPGQSATRALSSSAERVVADDPEVPERAPGLGAQGGDLLAQPDDVLGQRVRIAGVRRGAAPGRDRDRERGHGDHQADNGQGAHADQTTMRR